MAQYLDRIQFFHDTYQPITPGSGTQYHGSTASELVAYTSSISPHIYTQGNKADSTREHKVFLVHQWPNLKVRNALRSIREVVLTPGWSPDTLMKVLPDVDEAFFDGLLRYRIEVAWLDTASVDFFGYTSFNAVENTCCIRLNRRTICFGPLGPRQQMFATLIHEMVHAWSFLYCLPASRDDFNSEKGWQEGHGSHWRWIMNLLDERTLRELGFSVFGYEGWEKYHTLRTWKRREKSFPFDTGKRGAMASLDKRFKVLSQAVS